MGALDLSWLSAMQGSTKNLSLLSAFVGALKAVHDDPAMKAPEWHEALKKLTEALDANSKPPSVTAVDWTALQAEWTQLKASLREQLPEALRPLTYKLSEFALARHIGSSTPGVIAYPLTASSTGAGAPSLGGVTFDVTSSASASLRAAVQVYAQSPQWARDAKATIRDGHCVVRFGLLGQLGASVAGSATPAWGTIGFSAGASASAALDAGFQYPSSRYFAQALYDSLRQMPTPGDLGSALDASKDADFTLATLALGGQLSLGGSLTAGVAVVQSVEAPWESSRVPLGKDPVSVTISAGAKVGVSWKLAGNYDLVVRRNGNGVLVSVQRKMDTTTGASIEISAVVDVDGLQSMLDPAMAKILPSSEPLIAKLGRLSDIRGVALDAIKEELGLAGPGGWRQVAQELLDVAAGGSGVEAKDALVGFIRQRLDAYGRQYILSQFTSAAGPEISQIAARISAELPGGAQVAAAFTSKANAAIAKVEQQIRDAYTSFENKLSATAGTEIQRVIEALEVPGATVGNFFNQVQVKANTVMQAITTWTDKYEAARAKVARVISKIESENLAIQFGWEYSLQRTSIVLMEVQFSKDTPEAQALYRSFWTGNLDNYDALVSRCEAQGSAVETKSVFKDLLTRRVQSTMVISVFGLLNASATTRTLQQLEVQADRSGRIIVAKDAVTITQALSIRDVTTEAVLKLTLEMLASDDVPPMRADYKASGEHLTADDIASFFGLLERVDAVSGSVDDEVRKMLWSGPASNGKAVDAAVTSFFFPDLVGWTNFLSSDAQTVHAVTRRRCLAALTGAVWLEAERGLLQGLPDAWIARFLSQSGMSEADFWNGASNLGRSTWIERVLDQCKYDGPRSMNSSTALSLRRLWEVERISGGSAAAWKALGSEVAFMQTLRAGSTMKRAEVLRRLDEMSSAVAKGYVNAFTNAIPDWVMPAKVNWQYVGLTTAIAELCYPGRPMRFVTKVETVFQGERIAKIFT